MAITITTENSNDATIQCCPNFCTKRLFVCGGNPPYSWDTTIDGGAIIPDGSNGLSATLRVLTTFNTGVVTVTDRVGDTASVTLSMGVGAGCSGCCADRTSINICCKPPCTLDCNTGVDLEVCGGVGPFTWVVLSGSSTVSPTGDHTASVSPKSLITPSPTFTASMEIIWTSGAMTGSGSCPGVDTHSVHFSLSGSAVCKDCNGVVVNCNTNPCPGCHGLHTTATGTDNGCTGVGSTPIDTTGGTFDVRKQGGVYSIPVFAEDTGGGPNLGSGSYTFTGPESHLMYVSDTRTQEMIDNPGCAVCDFTTVIVQVTDNLGNSSTIGL